MSQDEGTGWSWSDLEEEGRGFGSEERPLRFTPGPELATSAMSTVSLAEDPLLRRQVVLKCVPGSPDSPMARRLLREARITASLALPGVAPVLEAGTDAEGRAWFAMQALSGDTLAALQAGRTEPCVLLGHLVDAARVLGRAHALGLVHRDLKPENLLVTAQGDVYVLDWGIARPEASSNAWDAVLSLTDHTAEGQVLGTPDTMSPEQVIGGTVDRRSDVWALGVLRPTDRLALNEVVDDLAVSRDGTRLAAGLRTGEVAVWDTRTLTLEVVLPRHIERVSSLAFSPDGTRLASGSWDETLRLWDLSVLDRPAAELDAEARARWGTTAEALLAQ